MASSQIRTYQLYNLYDYDPSATAGMYDIPEIMAETFVPDKLIGFNHALS